MSDLSDDKVVPITILTGFLGAGKTTLLNRILNGDHGLRVAVLVNDFGAINIDAELVVGVQDDVISLANGCVCCTIRDDLLDTVMQTINRREAPEYILLEASGVADPSGIAMTFVNPELEDRIRLDSITCVADADQVFAHPEYPAVEQLKLRQIAFADMMILNKTDLAGAEQVKKVRAWIDGHFSRLRIVETSHCDVPLEILLSVGRFDPARLDLDRQASGHAGCADANCRDEHHGHDYDHSATFSTWSYETTRPLSLEALRKVARKLPGNIYRAKGVVYASDAPSRRAVLQVVGKRVDITLENEWGARTPCTQIVVIGEAGSIDTRLMEGIFTSCMSAATADIVA
jgi:G3E family GTPase